MVRSIIFLLSIPPEPQQIMGIAVHIEKAFLHFTGQANPALDIDLFQLRKNQWTCLLGPSGCGKSSLLRLIAGLVDPQHRFQADIKTGDGLPIRGRVAYMAQQDLLLPWLTAIDNVCLEYRLRNGRLSPSVLNKGLDLLKQLGLPEVAHKKPDTLSGGQRQRIALARTLMLDRPLVLMDEPFSALDAVNRLKLQTLAAEYLKNRTVLLVTHDPQEAVRLGEQLYLLDGHLQKLQCPDTSIPRPVNAELGKYQAMLLQKLGVTG